MPLTFETSALRSTVATLADPEEPFTETEPFIIESAAVKEARLTQDTALMLAFFTAESCRRTALETRSHRPIPTRDLPTPPMESLPSVIVPLAPTTPAVDHKAHRRIAPLPSRRSQRISAGVKKEQAAAAVPSPATQAPARNRRRGVSKTASPVPSAEGSEVQKRLTSARAKRLGLSTRTNTV